jgi:hypothetical protein
VKIRLLVCVTVIIALAGCAGRQVQTRSRTVPQSAVAIPSGTDLLVRIVETIDVSEAIDGKAWAAVVSRDVRTPGGDLLVGAGSPLYLGVVAANGQLQLIVQSVVANGNSYLSNVPVTPSGGSVTGLEPWGPASTSADIRLSGSHVFLPAQTLILLKLREPLTLG